MNVEGACASFARSRKQRQRANERTREWVSANVATLKISIVCLHFDTSDNGNSNSKYYVAHIHTYSICFGSYSVYDCVYMLEYAHPSPPHKYILATRHPLITLTLAMWLAPHLLIIFRAHTHTHSLVHTAGKPMFDFIIHVSETSNPLRIIFNHKSLSCILFHSVRLFAHSRFTFFTCSSAHVVCASVPFPTCSLVCELTLF